MSPKKNNLKFSRIYERCKSKLNLHNIASHNIGNMYGQYLRNQDIEKTSSKKLPYTIWVILSSIFNENMSIIIGSIIFILFGMPRLIFYALSEKKKLFTIKGEIKDGIIFINGKKNVLPDRAKPIFTYNI